MIPNEYEIEVLKMMNGDIPWEKGSWVNAAFEFLQESGYITKGGVLTTPMLTEKGHKYLQTLTYEVTYGNIK